MEIVIPALDDPSILRNVLVRGHKLTIWDTGRMDGSHTFIGYAFTPDRARKPLFVGADIGIPSHDTIDSDKTLAQVLGWLTLKPGDTDADFFGKYTPAQLTWATSSDADYLACLVSDLDCDDHDSRARYMNGVACFDGNINYPIFLNVKD